MQEALQELPLALFTTLGPIGAGAFIMIALTQYQTQTSSQQKALDKLAFIPLALVAIGFIAAFFHLAQPAHAFYVFSGLGTSPMSNEIAVGGLFFVLAAVYCILALRGILSDGARRVFASIVAVAGIIFAVFCGLAYWVSTIPSWATPSVALSIVGFSLVGGITLGSALISFAQASPDSIGSIPSLAKRPALALIVIGCVLAVGDTISQYLLAGSLHTAMVDGSLRAASVYTPFIAGIILVIVGALGGLWTLAKSPRASLLLGSAVVVTAGVFCARLAFYGLRISVGI